MGLPGSRLAFMWRGEEAEERVMLGIAPAWWLWCWGSGATAALGVAMLDVESSASASASSCQDERISAPGRALWRVVLGLELVLVLGRRRWSVWFVSRIRPSRQRRRSWRCFPVRAQCCCPCGLREGSPVRWRTRGRSASRDSTNIRLAAVRASWGQTRRLLETLTYN
jgi:hypothetical protein